MNRLPPSRLPPGRLPTGRPPMRERGPVRPPPVDPVLLMERARSRSQMALLVVALTYGVLMLRGAQLMMVPEERLGVRAASQYQTFVTVEAPRGEIRAVDGSILATTVRMPELHADPSVIPPEDVEGVVNTLLEEFENLDPVWLTERLSNPRRRDVKLAVDVNPEDLDRLLALAPDGVLFSRYEPTRYYPGRELAAQVLGVVSRTGGNGLEGVERQLDNNLSGSTFRYMKQRDRRGRTISSEVAARRAEAGDVVTLTLDPTIQRAAEDALDRIVEISAPIGATAVVMDVQTGAVLGMASRPTTNPNDRGRRESAQLRNRAVSDVHEPGSVLKPFVMALGLDEEIIDPDTRIDCEGGKFAVGGRTVRDDHKYNWLTASQVIKYSSNIGMAKIAASMGAERTIEGLRDFGFGERTRIQVPAEMSGMLRDAEGIHPLELANTAFGQGMTATAMQLTSAMQALGNGGVRMKPRLVWRVEDRHGQIEMLSGPTSLGRVVSKRSSRDVLDMMQTVMEEGGTGTWGAVPGYTSAGKTGTAEKVVDRVYSATARVSSFMGVAPASNPRIAVVVMVDTPTQGSRYGGPVAGPAFRTISQRALRHLGVPEDMPREITPDTTKRVPLVPTGGPELSLSRDGRLRVPDYTGQSMRDVLASVEGTGLELALSGSGHASHQSPAAGLHLTPGERLEVHFD